MVVIISGEPRNDNEGFSHEDGQNGNNSRCRWQNSIPSEIAAIYLANSSIFLAKTCIVRTRMGC
jgi:hypothetical protein